MVKTKTACYEAVQQICPTSFNSRFFAGQNQTGQNAFTLFSDYILTKNQEHSQFKQGRLKTRPRSFQTNVFGINIHYKLNTRSKQLHK